MFTNGGPWITSSSWEDPGAPKAYLNYILFDENWQLVNFGFDQVSTAAASSHEYLSLHVNVEDKGYLYVYLSNEQAVQTNVYFDDLKILYHTAVEQSQDYYPFGLTFNSYERQSSIDQDYKFQGQEHIDDLDLGWDSFKWRNHQPDIGRFFNIDPISEKYYYNSPYAFSENKVIAHRELEGLESSSVHDEVAEANRTNDNGHRKVDGAQRFWKAVEEVGEQIPGKAASVTDLNDATVLGTWVTRGSEGSINADGTPAGRVDKGFAIAGVFAPGVSGAAIKVVLGGIVASYLVRFGDKAEIVEDLAEQAARAEANGFPHGVSTKQVDKLSKSDLDHKVATKSDVETNFEVKQTGNNPKHHTVILPKPVTQEVADLFNQTFIPPSLKK